MMKPFALTHFSLAPGFDYPLEHALLIDSGRIAGWLPEAGLPPDMPVQDCGGDVLAAGFIDIQVNGGGGVMFNDQPTPAGLDAIRRGHWSGGTTALLPTLITDKAATMRRAVGAVAEALDTLPGILGIHLEGPHLNVQRKGVHAPTEIRPFDADTDALLKVLPADKYLLTLAPELLPAGTIRALSQRGIRVSAGHTAATYAEIRAALDEGLGCFTHLYNAMTPMTSREPGVVGAALEDANSYCGIIIDGYHLHPTVAKLAIASKARGKMVLVTDAMATVGSDDNTFTLYGETIHEQDGRCAKVDGTLAGSALDMAGAVRNCVHDLGIPLDEALRMASQYPAEFLGIAGEYGQIKPGYRADLVLLDKHLQVRKTWVLGELCFERMA